MDTIIIDKLHSQREGKELFYYLRNRNLIYYEGIFDFLLTVNSNDYLVYHYKRNDRFCYIAVGCTKHIYELEGNLDKYLIELFRESWGGHYTEHEVKTEKGKKMIKKIVINHYGGSVIFEKKKEINIDQYESMIPAVLYAIKFTGDRHYVQYT